MNLTRVHVFRILKSSGGWTGKRGGRGGPLWLKRRDRTEYLSPSQDDDPAGKRTRVCPPLSHQIRTLIHVQLGDPHRMVIQPSRHGVRAGLQVPNPTRPVWPDPPHRPEARLRALARRSWSEG